MVRQARQHQWETVCPDTFGVDTTSQRVPARTAPRRMGRQHYRCSPHVLVCDVMTLAPSPSAQPQRRTGGCTDSVCVCVYVCGVHVQ